MKLSGEGEVSIMSKTHPHIEDSLNSWWEASGSRANRIGAKQIVRRKKTKTDLNISWGSTPINK